MESGRFLGTHDPVRLGVKLHPLFGDRVLDLNMGRTGLRSGVGEHDNQPFQRAKIQIPSIESPAVNVVGMPQPLDPNARSDRRT